MMRSFGIISQANNFIFLLLHHIELPFRSLEQSSFPRVFRQQITDLIIIYRYDLVISTDMRFFRHLQHYILKYFENLEHLSITGAPSVLSLRDFPLTAFSSSTLQKLCVWVNYFEDCLGLLDGRLKHLTTLTVLMCRAVDPLVIYTKVR